MNAIGIIGEDDTDVRTVKVLLRRILPDSIGIRTRAPATGGCARMRRCAAMFMRELVNGGCNALVIVHDLDLNPENNQLNSIEALRQQLNKIPYPQNAERLICIPVEELEAWFWSDQDILDHVGRGGAKAALHPHSIRKPKEELRRLSAKFHRKPVYSTNMNEELAAKLNIQICAERCESFKQLHNFVVRLFVTPNTAPVLSK